MRNITHAILVSCLVLFSGAGLLSSSQAAVISNHMDTSYSIQGIAPYQVYQRDDHGFGRIPFLGTTASSKLSGAIKARVLKGKAVLQGWKEAGFVSDSKISGEITQVPTGGEYTVELYFPDGQTKSISHLLVGDLWVMAGQSNMDGSAKLVNQEEPDEMVHCFYMDGRWDIAKDPLVSLNESVDPVHWTVAPEKRLAFVEWQRHFRSYGAGLGVRFGKELFQHTGVPVGLIPCSHGGSSISQWNPARKGEGGHSLYGSMIRRIQAVGGKVAGCLWYQGEADAKPTSSPTYKQKMKELFNSIRQDTGEPDLPIIYAQLATTFADASVVPDWNIIQNIQLELEREMNQVAMVTTVDLSLSDKLHLDAISQRKLGARMAHEARILRFHEKALLKGPRPAEFRMSPDRKSLSIFYRGVNRNLVKVPRVMGFLIEGDGMVPIESTRVEGNRVILQFARPAGANAKVWYGRGYNPAVNLIDSSGLPVPVFGPVSIP